MGCLVRLVIDLDGDEVTHVRVLLLREALRPLIYLYEEGPAVLPSSAEKVFREQRQIAVMDRVLGDEERFRNRRAAVAKTVELSVKEWNEVLRRLKKYADTLTKGSVLQGSADDADDLVERAVTRWLQRDLAWREDTGPPTVPAVVGYLKKAVLRAYLDRLKQSAARHEAPMTEDDIPVNEEIKLLREHLDHLVAQLRPFLKEDPLAELYVDLQLASDEFLSDDAAAGAIDRDVTAKDIRNMKKRLERHVRDMRMSLQAN